MFFVQSYISIRKCFENSLKNVSGRFDVLPLVLSGPDGVPKIYEIPEDIVIKVKIKHPNLSEIEKMNLEWYALPAVSGMLLEIGKAV